MNHGGSTVSSSNSPVKNSKVQEKIEKYVSVFTFPTLAAGIQVQ